jgi:hypothetical protein
MKSGRQDMMYQQQVSQVDGRLSRRLIQFNGLACDVADQSHPLLLSFVRRPLGHYLGCVLWSPLVCASSKGYVFHQLIF